MPQSPAAVEKQIGLIPPLAINGFQSPVVFCCWSMQPTSSSFPRPVIYLVTVATTTARFNACTKLYQVRVLLSCSFYNKKNNFTGMKNRNKTKCKPYNQQQKYGTNFKPAFYISTVLLYFRILKLEKTCSSILDHLAL